jgi:Mg2+-importing ATPase
MDLSSYTIKTVQEIQNEFKTSERGLSKAEVLNRQVKYGLNKIEAREIHWWQILFRQFKSSFIYLLFIAAFLAFFLGEKIDAVLILAFMLINVFLSFVQEFRSEQALKFLKKYIVPQVLVRRENQEMVISSYELVPGDFIFVKAGDIIPADTRFTETQNLVVDEEVLTGESVPVSKIEAPLQTPATEIYQAKNIGFSGTAVIKGQGAGIVLATGKNSTIGKIAKLTIETKKESIFEKNLLKFSKFILKLILITLTVVFLANIFIREGKIDIIEFLIFSIALAVSAIPEPLPAVTTISLSLGALRLAKNKVVVKRLSAVEDLGSIEILCSDKTGTLTENKLTVAQICSQDPKEALFYANLTSEILDKDKGVKTYDPFDIALWERLSEEDKKKIKFYKKIYEIPFDPGRKRNSALLQNGELVVRGAPELLIKAAINLAEEEKNNLLEWFSKEGENGRRVLAVGKKKFAGSYYEPAEEEKGLQILGLISFVDPIKSTAWQAIKNAKNLGVQIKILTGDSKEVSSSVAYELGLIKSKSEVLLGEELDKMSSEEQKEAVEKYSVFARVSPEQKYKIVQLLQKKYEVGFLGEGINDAPALKIANLALVVPSAAPISAEVSDIVLLEKSLDVIINGIAEGRKIFTNISKYIKITLSSNLGNFYALAFASFLIKFLPMLPIQILLLNLLSDFPMIALAADQVDPRELKRPKLYNMREIALLTTILGATSTIFDFIFFGLFYRISPAVLQTNWFIGSVLTELALIYSLRTKLLFFKAKRVSNILLGLTGIAFFAALIIPFSYFGQNFFKFIKPESQHLALVFVVVVGYFVVTEVVKLLYYRYFNHEEKR